MARLGSEARPLVLRVRTRERAEEVAGVCEEHGWKFVMGVEPGKPEDVSGLERLLHPAPRPEGRPPAPGRNDPCPCGSGLKYKRCCLGR